jgi:hypothetical protein
MSMCTDEGSRRSLDLPPEFEDLTGLLKMDLNVIVSAITERASTRFLLPRRQVQRLQRSLWNKLAQAINETVEPLAVERR